MRLSGFNRSSSSKSINFFWNPYTCSEDANIILVSASEYFLMASRRLSVPVVFMRINSSSDARFAPAKWNIKSLFSTNSFIELIYDKLFLDRSNGLQS